MQFSRRAFVIGAPLALAGCATDQPPSIMRPQRRFDSSFASLYAAVPDERFPVPAIALDEIDPRFFRQQVRYRTHEQPGTVIVDVGGRHAYLVMEHGRALRYGIGVGKQEAFNFKGAATVGRKAEWPRWTPTPDMIRREPGRYGPYAGGLPGGTGNPLGARALYLYRDGGDTLYRLHGTTEPWTIGTMVSSGCVRFFNQDIIDLYRRVPVGAKIVVLPSEAAPAGDSDP